MPDFAQRVEVNRLRAALRGVIDLLVELRDCPLSELEQREVEINAVIAEAERLLPPSG